MSGIESIIGGSSGSLQMLETNTIGKDAFLQMMIAQLQNQDPLNPLDGTEFTAQLAQFSSLEQLNNMNTQLETLALYQSLLNNTQSIGFIGKDVVARGDDIKVDGGTSADLAYNLPESAERVAVSIYDEGGNLVDTLELGAQQEGTNSVTWNCSGVATGNYRFEVFASDANENAIPTYTIITGKVTGISFEEGAPIFSVNGQYIPFGDIISVNEP